MAEWFIFLAWLVVGGCALYLVWHSGCDPQEPKEKEPEKPHVQTAEREAIKKKLLELKAKKARKEGRK